jgi:hypothetical protein
MGPDLMPARRPRSAAALRDALAVTIEEGGEFHGLARLARLVEGKRPMPFLEEKRRQVRDLRAGKPVTVPDDDLLFALEAIERDDAAAALIPVGRRYFVINPDGSYEPASTSVPA